MVETMLQITKAGNVKDSIYLALAIGAAVLLFVLSKKFRRKA